MGSGGKKYESLLIPKPEKYLSKKKKKEQKASMVVHPVEWRATLCSGLDVNSFIFIWLCDLRRNGTYMNSTNKLIQMSRQ